MNLHLVAALLARGRQLERGSDALTLLAVVYGLAPLLELAVQTSSALLCALLLLSGVAHKYWALRVSLDADLFARLANSTELEADTRSLDQALFDLKLKASPSDPRDWPTRSQAALTLLRRQGLCLALQVLLVLIALLTLPFTG